MSNLPGAVEAEEINADPDLRREVRTIAADVERLAKGCGALHVAAVLAELVPLFGVGAAAEKASFWTPYTDVLSDIPAEALVLACKDYVALPASDRFPKPGPLRALALKRAEPIFKAVSRIRRVLAMDPPRPPLSDEERAAARDAVRKLVEEGLPHRP